MKRGLVIGKFYPPHNGHKYLISSGLARVQQLTVIVCEHQSQKISGTLRAQWIKEMVPEAEVIVIPDGLPDDDSKGWAEYTLKILGYAPNIVFSSEDYGEHYAKFMGAKHILVDKERKVVPVSARYIRKEPLKYWEYLPQCVRAYFVKRVCLVGAESSGKTTMAKALAEYYKTIWVPEFGREYSAAKIQAYDYDQWQTDEFVYIARKQNEKEDELARNCNKLLICDTDSFATSLWHERYKGFISSEVDKISDKRNYDTYMLTDIDVPFKQDGTRDGEHIRGNMHKRFQEELNKRNKPYVLLTGNHNKRLDKAIELCNRILAEEYSI